MKISCYNLSQLVAESRLCTTLVPSGRDPSPPFTQLIGKWLLLKHLYEAIYKLLESIVLSIQVSIQSWFPGQYGKVLDSQANFKTKTSQLRDILLRCIDIGLSTRKWSFHLQRSLKSAKLSSESETSWQIENAFDLKLMSQSQ